MATGDYARLRAAHADRERAAYVLKAAFAEGRLDRDELAERVELAYRARTHAELAELSDDLPLGALPQPPTTPSAPPPYPYPPPYPHSWPAIPEPDEPPMSLVAGAALALAAASPLIGGLTGPPALVLGFLAIADITVGCRSGAFWAVLALLFGAVGAGLFFTDSGSWWPTHLIFG